MAEVIGRNLFYAGRFLYNDYRRRAAYARGARRARASEMLTGRANSLAAVNEIPRLQNQLSRISRSVGRPEVKYLDTALSLINVVDTTGAIQILTACSAGTGVTNRVGNK